MEEFLAQDPQIIVGAIVIFLLNTLFKRKFTKLWEKYADWAPIISVILCILAFVGIEFALSGLTLATLMSTVVMGLKASAASVFAQEAIAKFFPFCHAPITEK